MSLRDQILGTNPMHSYLASSSHLTSRNNHYQTNLTQYHLAESQSELQLSTPTSAILVPNHCSDLISSAANSVYNCADDEYLSGNLVVAPNSSGSNYHPGHGLDHRAHSPVSQHNLNHHHHQGNHHHSAQQHMGHFQYQGHHFSHDQLSQAANAQGQFAQMALDQDNTNGSSYYGSRSSDLEPQGSRTSSMVTSDSYRKPTKIERFLLITILF